MRAFIRFSAFVLSALSFLPAGQAAETGRHVVTTQDGDYFGFDLRTEQNVSLADCEKVCIADSFLPGLHLQSQGEMVLSQIRL